jgi:membrane protease YdiL (CAAX protease family)
MIGIVGCCMLGLVAQGAKRHQWLEKVLRVIYCLVLFGEIIDLMTEPAIGQETVWTHAIVVSATVASALLLFSSGRQLFSLVFTFVNQIVSGRFLLAAFGKLKIPVIQKPAKAGSVNSASVQAERAAGADNPDTGAATTNQAESQPAGESASPVTSQDAAPAAQEGPATVLWQKATIWQSFIAERIFLPESIPHMNALWIYVTCLAIALAKVEPAGFKLPAMMLPMPVTFDQLFSYNFLGLIVLSCCGAGIFVSRKPMEVLRRLGLVKPTFTQVLIGIAGIFFTFAYDYIWSTYTHSQPGMGYAGKLSNYNEGTFTPGGAPGPAFFLASATGICAGVGEEILTRGALQPVLGILPAAIMHGALHEQFSQAPIFIVQVLGWSVVMGVLRRYTNTTTTIIAHVGFNFLSVFLIAFNP